MAKSLKTVFQLLDRALQDAIPARLDRDYPAINAEMDANATVKAALAAFDKTEKAHQRASTKLALAKRRVMERIDKRNQKQRDAQNKAWGKMKDEVEHLKITLSLGVDASEQVLALLKKMREL